MTTTQPQRFTLQEYHPLIESGFFDQSVGEQPLEVYRDPYRTLNN